MCMYGFHVENLGISIALAEVPVTVQKHLVLTPSYLFVNVPPSGLSLLTTKLPSRTYQRNRFRITATIIATWHRFLSQTGACTYDGSRPLGNLTAIAIEFTFRIP